MVRRRPGHPGEVVFVRVALVVATASTAVFAWFLTFGRGELLATRRFGEVFDLQTRALLDGRLWVPDGSLGFEGFVVDGRTYAYFGLFPSIIRMPILALTDRFDGRLTAISMLVAYVIALWAAAAVVARVRRLTRPGQPWTTTGLVAATTLLVVVGVGSNLLFLASGAWVYHEASLWGAAAVFAAFAATLRYLERGGRTPIVAAGVWTLVAWTSRGSVALAPSIVLGLLGVAHLTGHRWVSILAPPPGAARSLGSIDDDDDGDRRGTVAEVPVSVWPRRPRIGAALVAAAVVGAVAFGVVNTAKFGSPTDLPMDKQVGSENPWPGREAALDVYDGSLFSARLAPSVLHQSLRPDLLRPSATWPFLDFSWEPPTVWGDLVFDTVEPSAGLTVTSPLLVVLATAGAIAAFRPRRRDRPGTAVVRPFLLGGLAATWAPLTIAFIAQRYLTDALPLLVVASAAAVAAIDGWAARSPAPSRARVVALRSSLIGLTVVGVFVTAAVTWSFQRFVIPPDSAAQAAALRAQVAVSRIVGDPPGFEQRPWPLLEPATDDSLVVVGDCDGVYRGQHGGGWVPVEVAATGGNLHLDADLSTVTAGDDPVAVVTIGAGEERLTLVATAAGPDRVRLSLARGGEPVGAAGPPIPVTGEVQRIELRADPTFAWVQAFVDGEDALFAYGRAPARREVTPGGDPDDAISAFPATVASLSPPTPTCDALVGDR